MKLNRYIFALLAAAALLVGCKKDDEDTKPSLSGKVTIGVTIPAYVQKGESFHIVASGAYRKSKTDTLVGYYIYDPITHQYDTIRTEGQTGSAEGDFVISVDSLSTFTMNVTAFAKGYYGTTGSASFTVVNPSLDTLRGSLKGHPYGYDVTTSFTDARDGLVYYATSLSSGGWMIQNLAWTGAGAGAGYPYADSEAMSYIAGRFYNWDAATTACPAGWKLPSDADFVALAGAGATGETIPDAAGVLKGDVSFNGSALWPYQNGKITITNDTFFTALPWGYLTVSAGTHSYKSFRETAVFWTADSVDSETALARYLKVDSNDILVQTMDKKSFCASVRCIKE